MLSWALFGFVYYLDNIIEPPFVEILELVFEECKEAFVLLEGLGQFTGVFEGSFKDVFLDLVEGFFEGY